MNDLRQFIKTTIQEFLNESKSVFAGVKNIY